MEWNLRVIYEARLEGYWGMLNLKPEFSVLQRWFNPAKSPWQLTLHTYALSLKSSNTADQLVPFKASLYSPSVRGKYYTVTVAHTVCNALVFLSQWQSMQNIRTIYYSSVWSSLADKMWYNSFYWLDWVGEIVHYSQCELIFRRERWRWWALTSCPYIKVSAPPVAPPPCPAPAAPVWPTRFPNPRPESPRPHGPPTPPPREGRRPTPTSSPAPARCLKRDRSR